MCYIIVTDAFKEGSIAYRTKHGPGLVSLKKETGELVDQSRIQLVTVSRLSAYGEYEPYTIVKDPESFKRMAAAL